MAGIEPDLQPLLERQPERDTPRLCARSVAVVKSLHRRPGQQRRAASRFGRKTFSAGSLVENHSHFSSRAPVANLLAHSVFRTVVRTLIPGNPLQDQHQMVAALILFRGGARIITFFQLFTTPSKNRQKTGTLQRPSRPKMESSYDLAHLDKRPLELF
jgi:hypothetical protein